MKSRMGLQSYENNNLANHSLSVERGTIVTLEIYDHQFDIYYFVIAPRLMVTPYTLIAYASCRGFYELFGLYFLKELY